MISVRFMRAAKFAAMVVAGLSLAACANKPLQDANAGLAGNAAPGSAQDFVVNVGDRVFFESDSSELTPQSVATLDKQETDLEAIAKRRTDADKGVEAAREALRSYVAQLG